MTSAIHSLAVVSPAKEATARKGRKKEGDRYEAG